MNNLTVMHFVSRHAPSAKQVKLAEMAGYRLVDAGDLDAFAEDMPAKLELMASYEECAIACVHPLIMAVACQLGKVGVFENANRAPEGEKPSFEAVSLRMVPRMIQFSVLDDVTDQWAWMCQ
jgi:hypothetical protein